MKRIALLFALLAAGPAFAADNTVIVTPGVGVTMKSKDVGTGIQAMQPIISDTSGVPIYGTAGTANANILSVQGIAAMTPILATVTGNLTNISGTISLPTGASTAAKQPALGTAGTASVDVLSVQGIASMTPLLTTSTGAAGTARIGYTSDDPCTQKTKINLPISQSGTASVQLIALSGATVIYVCSLSLVTAGATTVALTTGTGAACVTGNAAVLGSTTAGIASSMSFVANGGLTLGNGGATIAAGAASSELCMVLGTNVVVAGNLTYVQQ